MNLKYTILSFMIFVGAAKSCVFYIEKHVVYLKKQIVNQQKSINLLKVEWTYLNQNSRLQKLANLYLKGWKPIEPKQMCDISKINDIQSIPEAVVIKKQEVGAKKNDEKKQEKESLQKVEKKLLNVDVKNRGLKDGSKILPVKSIENDVVQKSRSKEDGEHKLGNSNKAKCNDGKHLPDSNKAKGKEGEQLCSSNKAKGKEGESNISVFYKLMLKKAKLGE